jgi:hypothetical protein
MANAAQTITKMISCLFVFLPFFFSFDEKSVQKKVFCNRVKRGFSFFCFFSFRNAMARDPARLSRCVAFGSSGASGLYGLYGPNGLHGANGSNGLYGRAERSGHCA